jgi:DNA-binding NtrC family response regulator
MLDAGGYPEVLAHEVAACLRESGATRAGVLASERQGVAEVSAWWGCGWREALAILSAPARTIPCGDWHGRNFFVAIPPAPGMTSALAVAAAEKLAASARWQDKARREERERAALWPIEPGGDGEEAIFLSERMGEIVRSAKHVAPHDVVVLLTGETGTGKEVVARLIHSASSRAERPFVPFNCTAVPREMIDSQLFGYRRGAFTGAVADFPGVIRAAAGGTLFLDEIGEMGADTQPKLLRFLESGEIHPLGDARPAAVNVRVIASTNANLEGLVADGRFREDLFYRLNVVRFNLPPLRERREEIPPLAEHHLARAGREFGKELRLGEETVEYLVLYRWPGNVRQLANEMRRLAALAENGAVLMPEHLDPAITAGRRTVPVSQDQVSAEQVVVRLDQPLPAAVEHLERAALRHALARSGGRVDEAARLLGLSRKGLYLKRQRLGFD